MSAVGTGGYAARSPELAALALAVVQPGFEGGRAPDWLLRRLETGLGGVALFGRNIEDVDQLARLTAQLHGVNPAALVAVDEEGGDVTRLEYRTGSSWPGNLALGAVDDVDLTRSVACEIGSALAEVGIDLDYAPDADVNVEASNPVIGVRSFGSDPALVARHTAAWTQGLQSAGVLACAKHFPGHGGTRVDSHLGLPEVDLGDDPTTSPALEPFRAAVAAGTATVMSGHLRVTGLDPRPATLVPAVMTGLLREHLGFTGLAVSDGLEMGAVADTVGLAEGAVLAVAAGVDALCIGGGLSGPDTLDLVVGALVAAVHDGRLTEERLAVAASRVAAASALRDSLRGTAVPASPGASAGIEAAARALEVTGSPTVRAVSPLVLQLSAASNIAVGDETVSGVVSAVRRRWADAEVRRFGPDTRPAEVAARATTARSDRPVWLVVRDAHRFGWMADVVAGVADVRPDVVVVDTGWPDWRPPLGIAHVVTRGGSRASGEAVVRHALRRLTPGQAVVSGSASYQPPCSSARALNRSRRPDSTGPDSSATISSTTWTAHSWSSESSSPASASRTTRTWEKPSCARSAATSSAVSRSGKTSRCSLTDRSMPSRSATREPDSPAGRDPGSVRRGAPDDQRLRASHARTLAGPDRDDVSGGTDCEDP